MVKVGEVKAEDGSVKESGAHGGGELQAFDVAVGYHEPVFGFLAGGHDADGHDYGYVDEEEEDVEH